MAKFQVRHLVKKRGRKNGPPRYVWEPSPSLRDMGWTTIPLKDKHGRQLDLTAAIDKAEQLNKEADAQRAGTEPAQPVQHGLPTLDQAIRKYKGHLRYKRLALTTRENYSDHLDALSDWAGSEPISAIDAPMVQDLYETLCTDPETGEVSPRAYANQRIAVLRLLLQNAVRFGFITQNPARKPGLTQVKSKARPWTRAEVTAMIAAADRLGRHSVGTAIAIAEWTGQRQSDILQMTAASHEAGRFRVEQNKTAARVDMPDSPALRARLSAERTRQREMGLIAPTLVISEWTKRPYTDQKGFSKLVARVRKEAVKPADPKHHHLAMPSCAKLTFLYLRHTAVLRFAEAGCTIIQIASYTGHTLKQAQSIIDRYLVRTAAIADEAARRRIAWEENLDRPVAAVLNEVGIEFPDLEG